MTGALARTFAALEVRNFRIWFVGRVISLSGNWMQSVALAWLVLELTGSGVALGLVTATEFVPVLVLGPWGGLLADRVDKRRLLMASNVLAASLAATLGALVLTGDVVLWIVYAIAAGMGLVRVLEMPARHAFVIEMVSDRHLANAVTLNSVLANAARVVGPAIAGVLIAVSGTGVCFLVNAGTYAAVIVSLVAMRAGELRPAPPTARRPRQIREGLSYVTARAELRVPLVVMVVVGTLALEWRVSLPLLADRSLGGGPGTYGALLAAMGAGAVLGGLFVAARGIAGPRHLMSAGLAFGVVILLAAAAPTRALAVAVMVPLGMTNLWFISTANATLQLTAAPEYRGRVMALYTMAFLGSTPVGGPIIGAIGEHLGARAAVAVGGLGALAASAWGRRALQRHRVLDPAPAVATDPARSS